MVVLLKARRFPHLEEITINHVSVICSFTGSSAYPWSYRKENYLHIYSSCCLLLISFNTSLSFLPSQQHRHANTSVNAFERSSNLHITAPCSKTSNHSRQTYYTREISKDGCRCIMRKFRAQHFSSSSNVSVCMEGDETHVRRELYRGFAYTLILCSSTIMSMGFLTSRRDEQVAVAQRCLLYHLRPLVASVS